jgi:hypothetical protein
MNTFYHPGGRASARIGPGPGEGSRPTTRRIEPDASFEVAQAPEPTAAPRSTMPTKRWPRVPTVRFLTLGRTPPGSETALTVRVLDEAVATRHVLGPREGFGVRTSSLSARSAPRTPAIRRRHPSSASIRGLAILPPTRRHDGGMPVLSAAKPVRPYVEDIAPSERHSDEGSRKRCIRHLECLVTTVRLAAECRRSRC